MARSSRRWAVLLMLVVPVLAPAPVLAHGGGHSHSKPGAQQPVSTTAASMYRWKDDQGRVHYSQSLHSVPERFRDSAVPLGQGGLSSSPAAGSSK